MCIIGVDDGGGPWGRCVCVHQTLAVEEERHDQPLGPAGMDSGFDGAWQALLNPLLAIYFFFRILTWRGGVLRDDKFFIGHPPLPSNS